MKHRIVLSDESSVMLTDDSVFLSEYMSAGIPAAGLLTGNPQQWGTGAFLVETALPPAEEGADIAAADTDIAEAYWRKIICRTRGLPWGIACTERLILRELCEADAPLLAALYYEVRQADGGALYGRSGDALCDAQLDTAALAERLCAYRKQIYEVWDCGIWGIFARGAGGRSAGEGGLIGRAGLERNERGVLELGYLLAPSQRGKGLAYEACCAIMEYARSELGSPEVLCRVRADNPPSLALAKKLQGCYPEVEVVLASI